METIYVEWSGPYSYDEIKDEVDKEEYNVKPTHMGLYQIYGSNPIYGSNVLIYIGKTIGREEDSKFSNRLKGREIIECNEDSNNLQIYLGNIYYDDSVHINH